MCCNTTRHISFQSWAKHVCEVCEGSGEVVGGLGVCEMCVKV